MPVDYAKKFSKKTQKQTINAQKEVSGFSLPVIPRTAMPLPPSQSKGPDSVSAFARLLSDKLNKLKIQQEQEEKFIIVKQMLQVSNGQTT